MLPPNLCLICKTKLVITFDYYGCPSCTSPDEYCRYRTTLRGIYFKLKNLESLKIDTNTFEVCTLYSGGEVRIKYDKDLDSASAAEIYNLVEKIILIS